MKTTMLTILTGMTLFSASAMAQTTNDEAVKKAILAFAGAADQQDAQALDQLLDNGFRLALNQFFGSKEVAFIDKATYLNNIRAKKFGGDKREVTLKSLQIVGKNATAQATFKGAKMTIVSLLQLVKDSEGTWKILNDLPAVQ
jgi:ketosteroid isomerase-like protein